MTARQPLIPMMCAPVCRGAKSRHSSSLARTSSVRRTDSKKYGPPCTTLMTDGFDLVHGGDHAGFRDL